MVVSFRKGTLRVHSRFPISWNGEVDLDDFGICHPSRLLPALEPLAVAGEAAIGRAADDSG